MVFEKWTPFQIASSKAMTAMTKDSLHWSHPDFRWRFRFAFHHFRRPGARSFSSALEDMERFKRFVEEKIAPMVKAGRWHQATFGVYVESDEDARRIWQALMEVRDAEGEIETVQDFPTYAAASAAAAALAEGLSRKRLDETMES